MSAENPRFLFTVVCDDVRQEVGNKMSMMGVYENSIILDAFPALVPRLCFVMKARTPANQPFERLKFIVRRDDEVIIEAELSETQLAAMATQENSRADDGPVTDPAERAVLVSAVMVVSPMAFEKPCRLRIRAITESEELRGGTLLVTTAAAAAELVAPKAAPAK
jgi:hypothetical protein